jgi:hypothetical protein
MRELSEARLCSVADKGGWRLGDLERELCGRFGE